MSKASKALNKLYNGFLTFKRANRGLYGCEMIRFGDSVSEMGNRTRRSFKPNIQYCTFYSEHLKRKLKVRVAASVIPKIDEAGGIDSYILNQPVPESWFAEKLKYNMLTAKHQAELRSQESSNEEIFKAA